MNRAQRRWYKLLRPGEKGWEWRLKMVVHVAANQIGKTLGLAVLILWGAWYKIGIDTSDPQKWLEYPYRWYHLSPKQPQAYLPLADIRQIIQGTHPTQDVGARMGLAFRLPKGMVEEVILEDYHGLRLWNGSEVYFRNTDEKAKALQGRRAAAISFDEAALEPWLNSIVYEVLYPRLVAANGLLMLISTPAGITEFYDFVREILDYGIAIDPDENGQPADATWVFPRKRWGLVWSTINDNIGFGLTQEAVDQMEEGLDESSKDQMLRGAFLDPQDAFFTPASVVLECFKMLPADAGPVPGRRYIIFWDPSLAKDPTAAVVLDVTKLPWRGVRYIYLKKPLGINGLLLEMRTQHALYNSADDPRGQKVKSWAMTGYDSTAMGGTAIRQSLVNVQPSRGLDFGGPRSKLDILVNLRAHMSQGHLMLPSDWAQMKRELLNYRLDDKGPNFRQDSVMALAGAVWLASKALGGAVSMPFDVSGRTTLAAPRR